MGIAHILRPAMLAGIGLAACAGAASASPALTTGQAPLLKGPATTYASLKALTVGTHVDVIWCGMTDDWCLVNEHGRMGWLPEADLNLRVGGGTTVAVDGTQNSTSGPTGAPGSEKAASLSDRMATQPSGSNIHPSYQMITKVHP